MQGVFDIVGPIMIGPSSSHTAGAARLGRVARAILGEPVLKAKIVFHGSFAKTYRGHGTDKALCAGLLDMKPDDERIADSIELAEAAGVQVEFNTADLGEVHPNTALMELTGASGRKVRVTGSSVGGGSIVITQIDEYGVELRGNYDTLLTIHQDKPGVISLITHILAQEAVNVAFMRVSRQERGAKALLMLEADEPLSERAMAMIENIPAVELVLRVPPVL